MTRELLNDGRRPMCCPDRGFDSRVEWCCSPLRGVCTHGLDDIRGLRDVGGCGNERYKASTDCQSDAVSGNRVGRGRERTCVECTVGSIGPCRIRAQRRRERGGGDLRGRRRPAESARRTAQDSSGRFAVVGGEQSQCSRRSQKTARRRARTGGLGAGGRGRRARAGLRGRAQRPTQATGERVASPRNAG